MIMNKTVQFFALTILFAMLGACSFVKLNPQAESTYVLQNENAASNCKLIGKTTASLWSSASTFQSDQKIDDQLNTLARNQASEMGGNSVLAITGVENSQRTFNVYKCPINN